MSNRDINSRAKALLLAGGLGTRLRPITDTTPKCMVDIAGRPLLDYWFEALAVAGVRDLLINTHHRPEPVRQYLTGKNAEGFHAVETFEPTLLGSAGTITANSGWADDADDVVIVYADNLSDLDVAQFLAMHRSHGDPMTMLLFHTPNPAMCGIAEIDSEARVLSFEEKPAMPKSDLANAGVYVVTKAAWREIAGMRAFDLGFDVLPRFVGRMRGYLHEGYHRDIGDLAALEAAREAAPRVFGRNRKQEKGSQ